MQKGFGLIGILIVIGIIALLGVGVLKTGYFARNPFIPTSDEKSTIKQAEEMKNLLEKKNDETKDWKTYRNEEYGFEVKYPSDWEAVEESISSVTKPQLTSSRVFRPMDIRVRTYKNEQRFPVREWYSIFLEGKEFSREGEREVNEIIINNQKALEISSYTVGDQQLRTYFPSNDKIIGIEFTTTGPADVDTVDLDLYNRFRETFILK